MTTTILESIYSNQVSAQAKTIKGELIQKVTQGKVELSWNPLEVFFVDGQEYKTTRYEVVKEDTEDVLVTAEGGDTASVTIEDVVDGIEHKVTLYAVDGTAEPVEKIALTGVQNYRTNPSVPQGVVAEELAGAIKIDWEAVSKEEGQNETLTNYFIYRSAQDGTSYQKVGEVSSEETTYTDSDVQPDTTYYYVVTSASKFEDA